jgi:hypothetical protein
VIFLITFWVAGIIGMGYCTWPVSRGNVLANIWRKCAVHIRQKTMYTKTDTWELFFFVKSQVLVPDREGEKVWMSEKWGWSYTSDVLPLEAQISNKVMAFLPVYSASCPELEDLMESCRQLGSLWLMHGLLWMFGGGIFQMTHLVLTMAISDLLSFLFHCKFQILPFTPWL